MSSWLKVVALVLLILSVVGSNLNTGEGLPRRILLDTDVNTDDLFAILYLLKLNRSEFNLEAVTISSNAWVNAGHGVNQIYDILYMMDRDDVAVGVGGEGGIKDAGTILSDVGGYFPIIEQGLTTVGECRYRQAIPKGPGGRLDIDTNYGFRKEFLPQGIRKYSPLQQPTVQQVLIEKVSAGPTTIFAIGTLTNIAILFMSHPHLKKNIEHIYIMGGGVRSKNPTGCCDVDSTSSCTPAYATQCGDPGNLFTVFTSNPCAEFNIFADPFAAYQVIHSGVPITLVPLDATNTIPITKEFFSTFEQNLNTHEAQYVFKTLKIARDTWFDDNFFTSYYMWDSFMTGVAVSIMSKPQNLNGKNEFAEMEFMNITVVTSNEPYGISDGSNPFFDGRSVPKFNLTRGGVHSGHVQKGLNDSFCLVRNNKGKCKDGYTEEVTGVEAVRVLVATKAKPNHNLTSPLNREYFPHFLDVLNRPEHAGRFNFTTQFPYYNEKFYIPDFGTKKLGKPVIFDMDMSAGDVLALFYLLKVPVEKIDLKAIIVTPTGWANAASIDVIYDILHMMGRDDILVGLGDVYAINQTDPLMPGVGTCKYIKAIPEGSGGFLDSDTLYGLARDLPRSPRRYTAENSVKFGAPRDTGRPELRQPLAQEVWNNVTKSLHPGSKITILTTGPLTSLAKIISSPKWNFSLIQDVHIVGGHISNCGKDKGNVFTISSNEYAEFNLFLDPLAAKKVFESELDITLIPLDVQRRFSSFSDMINMLHSTADTPEAEFARHLLSMLNNLKHTHSQYRHMDTFLGDILGAVFLAGNHSLLKPTVRTNTIKVFAQGVEFKDGQIIPYTSGKSIKVLENLNSMAYYKLFADQLGNPEQSATIGSFSAQVREWTGDPSML